MTFGYKEAIIRRKILERAIILTTKTPYLAPDSTLVFFLMQYEVSNAASQIFKVFGPGHIPGKNFFMFFFVFCDLVPVRNPKSTAYLPLEALFASSIWYFGTNFKEKLRQHQLPNTGSFGLCLLILIIAPPYLPLTFP